MLKLVIIHGTDRKGNKSQFVAQHVKRIAEQSGTWDVSYVDPKIVQIEREAESNEFYSRATAEADAFFIVTPEYNHMFPGSLKTILDTEFGNYLHKPVVVAGVSSGKFSGVRAIASLAEVLREIGLVMSSKEVNIGPVSEMYDEHGNPASEVSETAIKKAFEDLKWLAEALKNARDNS